MALLDQDQIKQITNSISIVDVISKYIDIQKSGSNFVGICPFHDDSKPSLSISIKKQIFKCFVCQVGGSAIQFLTQFKNISFMEAIEEICNMSGFILDKKFKQNVSKDLLSEDQRLIANLNLDAQFYFINNLFIAKGSKALEYLKNRQISLEQMEKFGIGFAPQITDLESKLLFKNHDKKYMLLSNLFLQSSDLKIRDYFRNRIIIPIWDINNNLVGFSGRSIEPNDSPKYLNISENILYQKKSLIYNIQNAASDIKRQKNAFLVEGYFDVIGLDSVGINNSIALMGSSATDEQIKILHKLTNKITLFLDPDNPGIEATFKTALKFLIENFEVYVVRNKTSLDPGDLINTKNKQEIEAILSETIHPFFFLIEQWFDKENKDLSENSRNFKNLLSIVKASDSINQKLFLDTLASKFDIPIEDLKMQFNEIKINRNIDYSNNDYAPSYNNNSSEQSNYEYDEIMMNLDDIDDFANSIYIPENNHQKQLLDPENWYNEESGIEYKEIISRHGKVLIYSLISSRKMYNEFESSLRVITLSKLLDSKCKSIIHLILRYYDTNLDKDKIIIEEWDIDQELMILVKRIMNNKSLSLNIVNQKYFQECIDSIKNYDMREDLKKKNIQKFSLIYKTLQSKKQS